MRELRILLVLIVLVGVTYWGVEPLAHQVFYPKVKPVDYKFTDLEDVGVGLTPNLENGKELVAGTCSACHSIDSLGIANGSGSMSEVSEAFGVNPPDLSDVGYLYSEKFLKAFLKNPVTASKLKHKFDDELDESDDEEEKPAYPMSAGENLGLDDQGIVDVVAYLNSIAKKEMSDKEVFVQSCTRCHSLDYGDDDRTSLLEPLQSYMGPNLPDLSQMIRSRGDAYLTTFINDPQKHIKGTSMPRVGLNQKSQEQVISYMQQKGDSSKPLRDSLGWKVMLYMLIFSIFAYLFKRKIWKDLK